MEWSEKVEKEEAEVKEEIGKKVTEAVEKRVKSKN